MRVLILLAALLSFQMFSQTTVTKYRINFSDIKKNLELIQAEFEEVDDHDDSYKPISRETMSNFFIFLELGERIEAIKLKDGSEISETVLNNMKDAIQIIRDNPFQTKQTIEGLEGLLYIFEHTDIIYLNEDMAIKFVDKNASRRERREYKKSYKKIRLKGLENLLRASGGVSSGGGG